MHPAPKSRLAIRRGWSERQLEIYERVLRRFYLEFGLSADAIGRLFGLSGTTVARDLQARGIPTRKPGRPSRRVRLPRHRCSRCGRRLEKRRRLCEACHQNPASMLASRRRWNGQQLEAYLEELRRLRLEEHLNCLEIGDRLELGVRTVRAHLRALGIPLRGGRPRKRRHCKSGCGRETRTGRLYCDHCRPLRAPLPKPGPRPCEGCGRLFTPEASKLARGAGRFHDYDCWNRWRRGRPQREWKP
jgi:hypothetical protein